MMSNDFDFENYYSNKALKRTDFYSIADMLYQHSTIFGCYPPSFIKTDNFFLTRSTTLPAAAEYRIFLFLVSSDRKPCFQEYSK